MIPIMKTKPCYYLYNKPRPGARTGHCALFIGHLNPDHPELSNGIYFSFYHAYKPSEIKSMTVRALLTGVKAHVVDSMFDDLVMRGQSVRRYELRKKEDINVATILERLPTEDKQKAEFIKLGTFDCALEISDVDVASVLYEINKIKKNLLWTPFSFLSSIVMRNPNIHNCSSAIWAAVKKSKTNGYQPSDIFNSGLLVWAYLALFAGQALCPTDCLSDSTSKVIISLPLIVYLASCVKNALQYSAGVLGMAGQSGKLETKTIAWVTSLSLVINLVGSGFGNNSSAKLFMTPGSLYSIFKSDGMLEQTESSADQELKPEYTY